MFPFILYVFPVDQPNAEVRSTTNTPAVNTHLLQHRIHVGLRATVKAYILYRLKQTSPERILFHLDAWDIIHK